MRKILTIRTTHVAADGTVGKRGEEQLETNGGWNSVEEFQLAQEKAFAHHKSVSVVRVAKGVRVVPIGEPPHYIKEVTLEDDE